MTDLVEQIERYEKIVAEAKDQARECRSAAKEAREERRRLERLLKEIEEAPVRTAEERVITWIEPKVNDMVEQMVKLQRKMEERSVQGYERHTNTLIYGNPHGHGKSIFDDFKEKFRTMRIMLEDLEAQQRKL